MYRLAPPLRRVKPAEAASSPRLVLPPTIFSFNFENCSRSPAPLANCAGIGINNGILRAIFFRDENTVNLCDRKFSEIVCGALVAGKLILTTTERVAGRKKGFFIYFILNVCQVLIKTFYSIRRGKRRHTITGFTDQLIRKITTRRKKRNIETK